MKINNFLLILGLCTGLRLNAVAIETAVKTKLDAIKTEKLIEDKVDRILALIKKEKENLTEEKFNTTKDTNPLFNPTDKDIDITREAKKRVKNQLFPEQTEVNEPTQSYWQRYAPEFMQNAATATSTYLASWNKLNTRTKLATIGTIIGLAAIGYNRDKIADLATMFTTNYGTTPLLEYDPNNENAVKATQSLAKSIMERTPTSSKGIKDLYWNLKSYPKGSIGDEAMKLVRQQLPESAPTNSNAEIPMQGKMISYDDFKAETRK